MIETVNTALMNLVLLFILQTAEQLISYFEPPINGFNINKASAKSVYRKQWCKKRLRTGRS